MSSLLILSLDKMFLFHKGTIRTLSSVIFPMVLSSFNSIKVRLELIIILRLETSESVSNEMQSYEKCLGKMSMPNGVFSVLLRQREFLWMFQ